MSRNNRHGNDRNRVGPVDVQTQEPTVVVPQAPALSERNGDEVVPNVIAELGRALDFIRRNGLIAAYKSESALADAPPPAPHNHRPKFWPKGQPTPTSYIRRQPIPCPRCLRLRLDDGSQSVSCTSTGQDVAFFRCKACEHRWKLAVRGG